MDPIEQIKNLTRHYQAVGPDMYPASYFRFLAIQHLGEPHIIRGEN